MLKSRTFKMFPSTLSKLLSQSYLSCQGSPFPKSVKKNVFNFKTPTTEMSETIINADHFQGPSYLIITMLQITTKL